MLKIWILMYLILKFAIWKNYCIDQNTSVGYVQSRLPDYELWFTWLLKFWYPLSKAEGTTQVMIIDQKSTGKLPQ